MFIIARREHQTLTEDKFLKRAGGRKPAHVSLEY